MQIGVNATAAFKYPRCGVEQYSYQIIKNLTMLSEARKHRFFLYLPKKLSQLSDLPENFFLKPLSFPIMWTQLRLSSEMFLKAPEVLFIPVHVLPLIHPKNSVVTIHGLEYEYYPKMYPKSRLRYLRWSTQYAVKQARQIIAASQSTKNDLIKFYKTPADKIKVIHHGFARSFDRAPRRMTGLISPPYILYLGRIELKKNIANIIKAFEILKEQCRIPHKLILAGSDGYGAESSKCQILNSRFQKDIILSGYVDEKKKQELLQGADAFLFPSFYEGFGFPILEAQSCGIAVITSNISSMPEVAGEGAVLVNPHQPEAIAQAVYQILNDASWRDKLINQGFENIKRFSWKKCAIQTLKALVC